MVAKATTLSDLIKMEHPLSLCFHFFNAISTAQASNGPCPDAAFHSMPIHFAMSSVMGISNASSGTRILFTLSMSANIAPTPSGEASVMRAKLGCTS
jgi:hypothetical protein